MSVQDVIERAFDDSLVDGWGFGDWALSRSSLACLLAWTSVATRCAQELHCPRTVLRAQGLIAPVVAIAMVAMTVATGAWWAVVGRHAPAALTGGSAGAHPSALVPQLMLAAALMVVATVMAMIGAARADVALGEL